jgi:hypothetical protein
VGGKLSMIPAHEAILKPVIDLKWMPLGKLIQKPLSETGYHKLVNDD